MPNYSHGANVWSCVIWPSSRLSYRVNKRPRLPLIFNKLVVTCNYSLSRVAVVLQVDRVTLLFDSSLWTTLSANHILVRNEKCIAHSTPVNWNYYIFLCPVLHISRRIIIIIIIVALHPFVGHWPLFSVSWSCTQSAGLLGRGISPRQLCFFLACLLTQLTLRPWRWIQYTASNRQ
jgi:hypothetical protein